MRRRTFFGAAATALASAHGLQGVPPAPGTYAPYTLDTLPMTIAGKSLEALRDTYRHELFERYLPFWEKGGYDSERGGFMCELYDDGTVQKDEKYIWYQGRAIWVYSHLYNNFGGDRKYLDIARKTRDFMVGYMHAGDGTWYESVDRYGKRIESTGQGTGRDIYGAMFAAAGLIEYFKAAGDEKDLELAKMSIWRSMERYNDPGYTGVSVAGIDRTGLRAQGHSFMTIWPLTQLLGFHEDERLEELQREHVSHIVNDFWNPEYGIVNEHLEHDYSRIPGMEAQMFCGHSLETLWMVMYEALRLGDRRLFDTIAERVKRLVEMDWDYIFDGWGGGHYSVFKTDEHDMGPVFDVKTMWAMCEVLIATMTIYEYTGAVWAKEWYERNREYTYRTMETDHGVWRQAVDRFGRDKKRDGISIYRKGNFHQPRYLMMNLQSVERLIANRGECTPFPKRRA